MSKTSVSPLPVLHSHALRVADLPMHHRDPFDRLLVAQALGGHWDIKVSFADGREYSAGHQA